MADIRRFDRVHTTVTDLDAATAFFGGIGGIGDYENAWQMAHVRRPEGIIVALAERLD